MAHSSFSFFFSSSLFYHRLVIIISILLLNPLPIIQGAPTEKFDTHHKRQINDNVFAPEQEVTFEGLLGCKYDSDICNQNEACFDDELFGQCWNGEGSLRAAFALKNGINELTNDKIIALEHTLDFLKRYHLKWKDYMTQCILSHILTDQRQHINQNRLELFYMDCLNKDELLDEFAAIREE